MRTAPANPIPLLALLGLLAIAPRARAGQGIADGGQFFSADAIRSAEEVINAVQVAHQKDLRIDTVDRIPNVLLPDYQQLGKQRFFKKWTNARAVKQGIDGVYIFICRDPGHFEAWVGNNTARRLFTPGDRDFLAHKLLTRFRQHEYDQGLLDAVHFVQRQMDDRSKATGDPNQPLLSPAPRRPIPHARNLYVGSASADAIVPRTRASPSAKADRTVCNERGLRPTYLKLASHPCHPERSEGPLTPETQRTQRFIASAQDDNTDGDHP